MRRDEFYFELLERSLDAAFVTRQDGSILFANPAACELLGYSLEELQERGRAAVVDAGDPHLAEALRIRREVGRYRGVITMVRKDGSRFPAEISSVVYRTVEERTSMVVRDVSEQQAREEALRATNERLSQALDEVQALRALLPICAYCKRIRDSNDYWHQVEEYLSRHAPIKFTHGICPSCYQQHFEK